MPPPPKILNSGQNELHQHQNTTVGAQNCINRRSSSSAVAISSSANSRRKSSLSYQQQLQMVNSVCGEDGTPISCKDASPGRYNAHPNEVFLQHHSKLSIQSIDRYDDALGCWLPPPSPAPNNDRYIPGLNTQMKTASTVCNESKSGPGSLPNVNGSCNNSMSGQHNVHMHLQYSSFECNAQPTSATAHPQQILHQPQHLSQTMSSSPSTSSLSTNSGGPSCNGGPSGAQLPSSSAALASNMNLTHKYVSNAIATMQHSISPNSRLRISDRFRDLSPKNVVDNSSISSVNSRTGTHFPMVSSDTYTYLTSTVHTPVKRYVPTPPPPNELYSDISIPPAPATITTSNTTVGVVTNCSNNSSAVHCTPHYRFRLKCCANEHAVMQQQSLSTNSSLAPHHVDHRASSSASDYYVTSPRSRAAFNKKSTTTSSFISCNSKDSPIVTLYDQQTSKANNSSGTSTTSSCISTGSSSASVSSTSSTATPVMVSGVIGANAGICAANNRQPAPSVLRATSCMLNDYVSRTPSIEYINASLPGGVPANANSAGRVITPVTADANMNNFTTTNANSNGSNSTTATCMHCNTVRRTTGVHQTTQTTGPISPVPLPQSTSNSHYSNNFQSQGTHEQTSSILTPSTAETHISPLSPSSTSNMLQSRMQQKFAIAEQIDSSATHNQPQMFSHKHFNMPPLMQNIIVQNNVTECTNVVSNSNQQQLGQPSGTMPIQQHHSCKKRLNQYLRKEIARFFGVEASLEAEDCVLWHGRQRRLALRRFGALKCESEMQSELNNSYNSETTNRINQRNGNNHQHYHHTSERPDILPAQDTETDDMTSSRVHSNSRHHYLYADFQIGDHVERKSSVATMIISSLTYIIHTLNKRQPRFYQQWSRSFAPSHVNLFKNHANDSDSPSDICEGLAAMEDEEVFFDSSSLEQCVVSVNNNGSNGNDIAINSSISPVSGASSLRSSINAGVKIIDHHQRQLYLPERVHGWRTSAVSSSLSHNDHVPSHQLGSVSQQQVSSGNHLQQQTSQGTQSQQNNSGMRGNRISAQLLDGVLENSRRPLARRIKLFSVSDLDDRTDHRPFFTYWINTVQILVLFLSLICYGIGPIGIGVEQKTGQVLVTSLSLQTVQHTEQRNVWIGPRNNDLVHMGAKFATCMRRDMKIMDVLLKTRRQERETACCIRNDDSGCVQSSQADCSVRGLFPTKSISTWKKWSPGESGPGGRISGSVCGLDPKYCDAPASIAPYEWPDDITKWPICRKTNSFSQRFRYKDHTAEHMVCEIIGHPCCTGVYGECRITTREYCDFVNGYFHEEASLCSQISCLNNVCGMFPFLSIEVPDQFYRLFTSLCLHAGILHLAITVVFQHIFLSDLERLIGPIRTAIVYIGSGLAGNLTSAVLVPYKPEVGPLASLCGVLASLLVLLTFMHWNQLRKPHVALFKLIFLGALLFGIGTLPWQLNFAGLLAGIFCGIFLTIALVPFVSVSKYRRKAKINLIWSCIIFHTIIYSVMIVIFYVFPTELTNLNFGEVLSNSFNPSIDSNGAVMGGNDAVAGRSSSSSITSHELSLQKQFVYHHLSKDIITNAALAEESGKHLRPPQIPVTGYMQQIFYHRDRERVSRNGTINAKSKNSNLRYDNWMLSNKNDTRSNGKTTEYENIPKISKSNNDGMLNSTQNTGKYFHNLNNDMKRIPKNALRTLKYNNNNNSNNILNHIFNTPMHPLRNNIINNVQQQQLQHSKHLSN